MEKKYNKLVRDNVPRIIEKEDKKAVTSILDGEEYLTELYKKLNEESSELISSNNISDTIDELADILEVLKSIAEFEGKSLQDVIDRANQKRKTNGGFEDRVFLEKTITR